MEKVVVDDGESKSINEALDGVQRWWIQVNALDGDDWVTVALAAVAITLVACLVTAVLVKCVNRWLRGEKDPYKKYLHDVINGKSSMRKKRS